MDQLIRRVSKFQDGLWSSVHLDWSQILTSPKDVGNDKYLHCGPSMISQGNTPWKDLSEGTFQVKNARKDASEAVKNPQGLSKGPFTGTSLAVQRVCM